ncbi:MAG: glycerophosphodiester phosphodiesterase [Pseudomonadales bacterium]
MNSLRSLATLAFTLCSTLTWSQSSVIAHRGASSLAPEHSAKAVELAHALHVDYIEQDLVMSRDNQLVVLHDLWLDNVTDVAQRYPGRARQDGRFYVIDFTLAELKTLQLEYRFKLVDGKRQARYPARDKAWGISHRIQSFEETLQHIEQLNAAGTKHVGIYPEVKAPSFHRDQGKDISAHLLDTLAKHGYRDRNAAVYIQSFDAPELERIRRELMPARNMDLKLVQLMAYTNWGIVKQYSNGKARERDVSWMFKQGGMQKIATYADAIGPWYGMLFEDYRSRDDFVVSSFVQRARDNGLLIHTYTLRADHSGYKKYADSLGSMAHFLTQIGVDGFFTDHPQLLVK